MDQFFYVYIPEGNYCKDENLITDINTIFEDNNVPLTLTFFLDYNNAGGIGNGNGKILIELDDSSEYSDFELNFSGRRISDTDLDLSYNQSMLLNTSVSNAAKLEEVLNNYYYTESTIPLRQRFGWLLGFRYSAYSGQTSYQSEGVLDIIGPKYLYLIIDDFNNTNNINFFSSSPETLLDDNIMARISLKGFAFSIQAQSDFKVYTEPRIMDQLI